jgi:hypothetical protein
MPVTSGIVAVPHPASPHSIMAAHIAAIILFIVLSLRASFIDVMD